MAEVLVLNSTYEPLGVVTWQRAMCLLLEERVDILEVDENEVIKSVRAKYALPRVIRLKSYVKHATVYRRAKFSRANVYRRDAYQCQYCGCNPPISEMTLDHVIPRSRGGGTSWTNVVCCCRTCNYSKNDRTPEEAGMQLLSEPVKPDSGYKMEFIIQKRNMHPSWDKWVW